MIYSDSIGRNGVSMRIYLWWFDCDLMLFIFDSIMFIVWCFMVVFMFSLLGLMRDLTDKNWM
jgi:hypothetical protein